MYPPANPRPSRAPLRARTARTASPGAAAAAQARRAAAPFPPLLREEGAAGPQRGTAGRRQGLRLRAQVLVLGGVLREHVVEDGEEARVLGEGARRRRVGARATDREVCGGRVGVEVG